MRKSILFLCFSVLLLGFGCMVNKATASPLFVNFRKDTIPEFSLHLTDSSWFNKPDIPKNKNIVLVYFNPDCGHCQLTAHEFEEKMDQFKDVFFIWVSYLSIPEIKNFAQQYNMLDNKNIVIGRDEKYVVPAFYKVKYTPFIAVYDKNDKLLQTWDGGAEPDTVLNLINTDK